MGNFGRDNITGASGNWGVILNIIACEAQMLDVASQKADSIKAYLATQYENQKMIAAIYEATGDLNLIGATDEIETDEISTKWYTFPFSTRPDLVPLTWYLISIQADYMVGAMNVKHNAYTSLYRLIHKFFVYDPDWPSTFPSGFSIDATDPCIYCAFSSALENYPVDWLKKKAITGYHCFMSGYLHAKRKGYNPLKLPDGTIF